MKPSLLVFWFLFLFSLFFPVAKTAFADEGYGTPSGDGIQQIHSSYNYVFQTLGNDLSGALTQIDIQTINPSFGSYGAVPVISLYECNDDTYGGIFNGSLDCTLLFAQFSDHGGSNSTTTHSFYPSGIILKSQKYYLLTSREGAEYAGIVTDTIPGSCFEHTLSLLSVIPCDVSDLYFHLYGIEKIVNSTTTGNSNVLFLPGVEASRLYRQGRPDEAVGEHLLWEPTSNQNVKDLYLNTEGKQPASIFPGDEVHTKDVLDEAYLSEVGPNIYKSFLGMLEEMKSTEHSINDYSAVPYDWRLSIDDILNSGVKVGQNIYYDRETSDPYILSELRRLASTAQNGKVTIIAHSNGGLVAKALLKKLSDTHDPLLQKIDKVIFVAVPQLGTPMAIATLLHGYDQGLPLNAAPIFLNDSVARGFAQNSPATYNLLPSDDYFKTTFTPIVTFDNFPDWNTKYGDIFHSEDRLRNFLIDTDKRVSATSIYTDTPALINTDLLTQAEAVHAELDDWQIPASIPVIEIAGWGVPSTLSSIDYHANDTKIKPEYKFTIDGDGTVVIPSALWNAGVSTTKYWVNEELWNKDHPNDTFIFKIKHSNILEVSELDSFIKSVVNQNEIITQNYISTSSPISTDNRLVYSLHSPLTLDIYDDFGNHTGVSTTTGSIEEQVPGTYYLQMGEVKYIFTNAGTPIHINMTGYDTGTFTFSIDEVQGDNIISNVTFKDIPTTPTTKVGMNVGGNINNLSALEVDSDSNGVSDMVLQPMVGSIVTYNPPVTTSITILDSLVIGNGPIMDRNTISTSSRELATTSNYISSITSPTFPKIPIRKISKIVSKGITNTYRAESVSTTFGKNREQIAQVISFNLSPTKKIDHFFGRFIMNIFVLPLLLFK